MSFFQKNYETIKSLAIIISAVIYLHNHIDSKFSSLEERLSSRMDNFEARLTTLEKDMSVIKTILIMQGTMPRELAHQKHTPSEPVLKDEIPVLKKSENS